MSENAENTNTTTPAGSPAPATTTEPTQPIVKGNEAAQAVPATSKAEDKSVAAFIRMRQERKADKQRIAELEARISAPPANNITPVQQPSTVQTPVQQVANPAVETAVTEENAIKSIAADPDIMAMPGGIVEVMELVDKDKRLTQLNAIDPNLAYSEAAKMYKAKYNISSAPATVAQPVRVSGGSPGEVGKENLDELYANLNKMHPASKKFGETVDKINALERKRRQG